ncbi:subtilisin-like serine-protease S [Henckelia pumila]|uniref:subtilisin-like serine-protease S n=1 Tax=Henckelia pumila TaxID=405737 RepID=UPI003C6E114E
MQHYIVYMGDHSHKNSKSVIAANHKLLASVIGSHDEAVNAAVHHYTKSFRGFSVMLTSDQAEKLSGSDSVVSMFKSKPNVIHTTHSWEFLGLNSIQQYDQPSTSDVIVGVIDTGVWPESKSFNDDGLSPVPSKFKGKCSTGENFTLSNCNRKIVGARFYYKGFEADAGPIESLNMTYSLSPRDTDGHGTHTASTIAGSIVPDVSLYGIAKGTARGGAPGARLAIYKACWFNQCSDADILSALDDAIHDNVDIISMSLGESPPEIPYFENAISIGSFHAFKKGVVVSASAGNGFLPNTAINVAPWILTVAASTIDRNIQSNIYLGNSKIIQGFGINPTTMEHFYGLIAGSAAAAPNITARNASFCGNNTLDPTLIKGKIVVCTLEKIRDDRWGKAVSIQDGGGVGIILVDPLAKDVGIQFMIPGTLISPEEAGELFTYIEAEKNPVARISRTMTVIPSKPAPEMASFSSRGPNVINPDIIKPDITAPGVNVLAAWSPLATDFTAGKPTDYNILSGTSMSCPHVSGIAAIVKASHPSWSPAAIKSAIMTTATIHDNNKNVIFRLPNGTRTSPFDYGSGHVNPAAATDPGLIYDFDTSDIIDFLCSTGETPAQLKNVTGGKMIYCKNSSTLAPSYDLNYPSIGVSDLRGSVLVHRQVTYYGEGVGVYKAEIEYPSGVDVSVSPAELRFEKMGEKKSFKIQLTPYNKSSSGGFVFGALTWTDGIHVVRSPIALNVVSS